MPLPRRMWAGGRIEFLQPLRIGDAIRRDSEIISVEPKHGRSGSLVFVTVRHTISTGNGEVAVREEHDIVYRDAAKPGDPPPQGKPAPKTAAWQRSLTGDPVLLFRYSALTFNGHRIHYDLDYVKNEEHYPGLIVHGPLQTTLLLDLCRRHASRPVRKLDYRALHPVFHTERFTVNGNPAADGSSAEVWTANAARSDGPGPPTGPFCFVAARCARLSIATPISTTLPLTLFQRMFTELIPFAAVSMASILVSSVLFFTRLPSSPAFLITMRSLVSERML